MTFSPDNIWSDEKIKRMKLLWEADLSMAGIAAEMGISRNSVIGKCNRLGLPSREQAPRLSEEDLRRRQRERQRIYDAKRRTTFGPKVSKKRESKKMETPPIILPPPAFIGDLQIPFRDLRDFKHEAPNQCRFIAAEPPGPDYLACGNETLPGESYCGHCTEMLKPQARTHDERVVSLHMGIRRHQRALRRVA